MGTVKYSGPVASFHCPTEATIRSLKVHFSPKQEGSGDPSPENVRPIEGWDGVTVFGIGKNLIDENFLSDASNYTDVGGYGYIYTKFIQLVPNTKYRFVWFNYDSDKISGTSVNLYCDGASEYIINNSVYRQYANGFTTNSTGKIRFGVLKSTAYTTVQDALSAIFGNGKLLLQVGTDEVAYEPYHGSTTNYEFGVLGKNKLDPNLCLLNSYWNVKQARASTSDWISVDYISVLPSTTYTITGSIVTSENPTAQHLFYNENKGLISAIPAGSTNQTFTTPNECKFVRLSIKNSSLDGLQLELGSTATAYEPYDPNKTVYGGWVDLVSGEVVEEWGTLDLGSLTWFTQTNENAEWFRATLPSEVYNNTWIPNVTVSLNNHSPHFLVDRFKITSGSAIYYNTSDDNAVGMDWKSTIRIRCDTYEQDADAFKTAMNEVILYYEYATPIIYHLAPTQLQTFLAQNNIWSNADYVEVEYDLHETQDILARKQFIIANQPHVVKPATAPLQNFVTDMAAPVKSCKVGFKPIQDLHGYDKPWVGGAGKNLFNINAPEQDPSDTTVTNTTVRVFTPGTYTFCASWSNWRDTARILSYSISNNTLTVNSTTGYGVGFALAVAAETSYAVSCTITGNGGHVNIAYYDAAGNYLTGASDASDINNTVITTPADATIAVLVFIGSYSDTPVTFSNIQFEKGTAVTSYEPYENICPISGWTGVEVYKAGENLIPVDYEAVEGKWKPTEGAISGSVYNMGQFPAPPALIQYQSETKGITYFGFMDGPIQDGEPVYNVITMSNRSAYPFDNTDGHQYALITANREAVDSHKVIISVGHTYKDYSEPSGTTIPITFPSEAGTIYGGYVDLVTGNVYNQFNCINMGTLSWNYTNGRFYAPISDALIGNDNNYLSSAVCDIYPTVTYNDIIRNGAKGIAINNTAYIRVYDDYSTIEDFISAINGHMLVYPLAVPVLLATLTPTQLKTLRGTNNIWSNANGNIELSYWKH